MNLYFGIVENRSDPLELGRCQVRVVGLHTHDKNLLPTSDLPWCATLQPTTSAAMNGIGVTPIGPVEGSSVVVTYLDDTRQQGLIMGSVGGISTEPLPIDFDDSGPVLTSDAVDVVSLRTVAGPTTGTVLKFYDPLSGRTDITSKLKANMRVFGYGIPDGTTIVSINSGTEITISTIVRDLGENIIEFKNPLQNTSYVTESRSLVSQTASISTLTQKIKPNAANNSIPLSPPPGVRSQQTKAAAGIAALLAACDTVGLTTKEQKCALLGICGGESSWIPVEEAYNYSESRIKQIFSFATDADVAKYSNASSKGISRHDFFSWVYGPTARGNGFLGHTTDDEAGNYYGRGFIQLTGKSNYEKFNTLLKKYYPEKDILKNPDLLITDVEVSAAVAALYLKSRVSSAVNTNAHPDYFIAAKKAVGYNSPDISARKTSYYEYFYGEGSVGGSQKDAGAASQDEPIAAGTSAPGPSEKSITSGSFGIGFRDPNNKYPLKEYIGESDVNRLARGVIDGTAVKTKDASRVLDVPKGIVGGTWSQPEAPFAAKYPFNKVYETESGHVQEFDDTPGHERIHTFHRSGTFTEIDANGTQVNYIVGDNYVLMEQNGCIHVAGECNITVDGNTNIFARTDANIEVAQNANIQVGNNLDIGVARDVNMVVGGNYALKVLGDYSIDAKNINTTTVENLTTQVDGNSNLTVKGNIDQSAEGTVAIEASGAMDILSGATMSVDYSQGNFGNGAGSANKATLEHSSATPPEYGVPVASFIKYSIPPERAFETKAVIETPEDWDTPEGRAQAAKVSRTEGASADQVAAATITSPDASSTVMTGGSGSTVAVDKTLINSTNDYTNDFRLSRNISLGMMIDGGVGGKHRLTPQMLKSRGESAERLYTVQEIVGNLSEVANNVLEPLMAKDILPGGIGGYRNQWKINSGYRLRGVVPNESATSDHCKGHCIDIGIIHPDKYNKTFEIVQLIESSIVYDQLILEYRFPESVWIHIGFKKDNNRRMAFTMVNDSTYKRNEKGIPYGFYLLNKIPPKGR